MHAPCLFYSEIMHSSGAALTACCFHACPTLHGVFTEISKERKMETISSINSAINNFVWGVPAMVCIFGIGLYLSIETGFIQIRKFELAMKETFGKIFNKDATAEGAISPFQALCTALCRDRRNGQHRPGVAGAIAIGGPGAVFWMWISALLGMCTQVLGSNTRCSLQRDR